MVIFVCDFKYGLFVCDFEVCGLCMTLMYGFYLWLLCMAFMYSFMYGFYVWLFCIAFMYDALGSEF